jgi:hypothetical protein
MPAQAEWLIEKAASLEEFDVTLTISSEELTL